jgi:hypothetical protein
MTTSIFSHCRCPLVAWFLLSFLLLGNVPEVVFGAVVNQTCAVYTLLPFTYGTTIPSVVKTFVDDRGLFGFTHMAAAYMALQHWNDRDASVIAEIGNYRTCPYQFDLSKSVFVDSSSASALQQVEQQFSRQDSTFCAMVGPYDDLPASDFSVLAKAAHVPIVPYRGFNMKLVNPMYNSFTTMVFPDPEMVSASLAEFLVGRGRTNFVSILASVGAVDIAQMLTLKFFVEGIAHTSTHFFSPPEVLEQRPGANVKTAVRNVKNDGFRTIVVITDFPLADLHAIADEAEANGLNNGDYFWVFMGPIDIEQAFLDAAKLGLALTSNITKLTRGAAYITASENRFRDPQGDLFLKSWKQQNTSVLETLKTLNPIQPGQDGYYNPPSNFFTFRDQPVPGASYIYDAMIAVGMGMCNAANTTTWNDTISGEAHRDGIRSVVLQQGASGKMAFGNVQALDSSGMRRFMPGARKDTTNWIGAFNIRIDANMKGIPVFGSDYVLSDRYMNRTWVKVLQFMYADGSASPPKLLRDFPNQNYLAKSVVIFGFTLMAVALFAALISAVYVFTYTHHRIIQAAQPVFLYILCLGSAIAASAIVPISFDEGNGWTISALSKACMATPWLISLGVIMIYGALFGKLWRVNKVLQFSRRKITMQQTIWPVIALVLAAFVVLSLWTALDPLQWERIEIDHITGESVGTCQSNNIWAFCVPLMLIILIPVLLAAFMSYKTIDVDSAYSDAKWIFMMIVLQVEVIVFAAPMIVILEGVSVNGRHVGFIVLFWVFPMSALGMIILPKALAVKNSGRAASKNARAQIGKGSITITGAVDPKPTASVISQNNSSHNEHDEHSIGRA